MKKIIVALDVRDGKTALSLVEKLSPWVDLYKVGPILFLTEGPELIRRIRSMGKDVFLDLKFHDIPATVQRSVVSAQTLGVYSLTLHSSGGAEMIGAASSVASRPKLWAVTILTSQTAAPELVVERALLAKSSGADGVIASPLEITAIKKACGKEFTVVTPGIRAEKTNDDQKRIATPRSAIEAGADFIVVGRPIIEAPDPAEAARLITEQISGKD
jgi:orotidine-5'-phosphate decarboxylase